MNFIRSLVHMVWMTVTVIPWALVVLFASMFMSSSRLYWWCAAWLRNAINSGTFILGIENRITGMENLPLGEKDQHDEQGQNTAQIAPGEPIA